MTEQASTGVALMREHEAVCERETREQEPQLVVALQEAVDCIIASAHEFDGVQNLTDQEQAVLIQIVLGARTARVFVALALTGQYESALAVARTLIEDGIAAAYLIERPDHAAKWRRGQIDLRYGDMAAAVMEAHERRDEEQAPGEGAAWRRMSDALRETRKMLDDMSHANPARIQFVLKAHGYELYPFFDRDALRSAVWFGVPGLSQMLFLTRKLLDQYGKAVPLCSSDEFRRRLVTVLDGAKQPDTAPSPEA